MTPFAAATLATILAGSSVPTPLYGIYQREWGLSPFTLTIIFAVYAVSLLASLLTVGSLSDHVGRKPVIFGSLVLSVVAMILFVTATSASWLIAARAVQGIAAGAGVGTLGAAILDTNLKLGPLINSVAPFVGMSAGALGSSLLATYGPAPTRLAYCCIMIVLVLQAVIVWWMPETGTSRTGAFASLRPHVSVPARARGAFVLITPGNIAVWALSGFYLSLMPSLVRVATGITSPMIGGVVVAVLTLCAAAAVLGLRNWAPNRILSAGTTALALGVAITLCGVYLQLVVILMLGTMIAGLGVGAGFSGAARTLLPLATPAERAGLLSAFYAQSYLAFSLPAIAVSMIVPSLGLAASSYLYGLIVILLAAVSLVGGLRVGVGTHRQACSSRTHS